MIFSVPFQSHLFLTWTSLFCASCISSISASLYHTGANYYSPYYAPSYPSYFAPPYYPESRYLYPSYPAVARVPLTLPAAAVPAAIPALPAVPTYKYVTVIPQNAPPHGYSINYFRKYLTTVPAVPAIPAIPAVPAVQAVPATAPAAFVPRPTLYAGIYPHVHQSALVPHVHSAGVPYWGNAGASYPQVQPPYPYRAAPTVNC